MKVTAWFASFAIIAATLLATPLYVTAEPLAPEKEATAKEIFFEVLSPFCPGRSLNDCPSSSAVELKDEIRGMVEKGATREEIINTLAGRYGENIRAVPAKTGFQSLAWAAPIVFLVLGGIVFTIWLSSRATQSDSATPPTPVAPLDPEMQKRIDQELHR